LDEEVGEGVGLVIFFFKKWEKVGWEWGFWGFS